MLQRTFHINTIYTVATFPDLIIFIKCLVACFLLNSLPHSFLKKLLHIHHVVHRPVHKSSLCSTANIEFIGGSHEETVCLFFLAINDRAIKAIVSFSKPCFSYTLRLSQHYYFLRENQYHTISLSWKQSNAKGRIWPLSAQLNLQ